MRTVDTSNVSVLFRSFLSFNFDRHSVCFLIISRHIELFSRAIIRDFEAVSFVFPLVSECVREGMLHVRTETGSHHLGGSISRYIPSSRPPGQEPETSCAHHHGGASPVVIIISVTFCHIGKWGSVCVLSLILGVLTSKVLIPARMSLF